LEAVAGGGGIIVAAGEKTLAARILETAGNKIRITLFKAFPGNGEGFLI
jgi:hypothetical protein